MEKVKKIYIKEEEGTTIANTMQEVKPKEKFMINYRNSGSQGSNSFSISKFSSELNNSSPASKLNRRNQDSIFHAIQKSREKRKGFVNIFFTLLPF